MLTKTLKFDDAVLAVIREMSWNEDGTRGVIVQALDRLLYVRVNKALEAMGGKWDRKAKAHVFVFDPRSQVEGLLENGTLRVERDGFFETPDAVIGLMLEYADIDPDNTVLEPSAGMGAIAKRARALSNSVTCVEKNHARAEHLRSLAFLVFEMDFLEFIPPYLYDRIVMNPPFEEGQDIAHVMHAYECLAFGGKLVSVMSEGTFFRSDKGAVFFRAWLDEVGGFSVHLPERSFHESGTDVRTRLVVITK